MGRSMCGASVRRTPTGWARRVDGAEWEANPIGRAQGHRSCLTLGCGWSTNHCIASRIRRSHSTVALR